MTDLTLREKLRQIRDSDHPASPWARNVIQIMDAMQKHGMADAGNMRALGFNVAMLERSYRMGDWTMADRADLTLTFVPKLTREEVVTIFALGTHQ